MESEGGRRRGRRGATWSGCRVHDVGHLAGHGEAHTEPHAFRGAATGRILGGFLHGGGGLEFGELIEVAENPHAGAFIQRLFHGGWQGNVLYEQGGKLQTVAEEVRGDLGRDEGAELFVVGRHIQNRDTTLADGIGEARNDKVAEVTDDFFGGEMTIGADYFPEEDGGIGNLDHVGAEGAETDGAELGIAQSDGVLGAPFLVSEPAGADKVDLGFERAFETISPALEGGEEGNVLGDEGVGAGREDIGEFALVDEDSGLAFADNELGAIFDLVAVAFEAVNERVVGVVEPFDDVDELSLKFVPECHN